MRFIKIFLTLVFLSGFLCSSGMAQPQEPIFDDRALLEGYAQKYAPEGKEILLAMIQDDTLSPYKMTAAVRTFREKYSGEVFKAEKKTAIKILLRRLNRTDSSFVQIEIMHILCLMDRYKYFDSFVPSILQHLNHYNETVNELAQTAIDDIIKKGHNRPREARIIFNALRRMLFLTRRRLQDMSEPTPKIKRQLDLLRWSIKILGNQQLKRLSWEVINLL